MSRSWPVTSAQTLLGCSAVSGELAYRLDRRPVAARHRHAVRGLGDDQIAVLDVASRLSLDQPQPVRHVSGSSGPPSRPKHPRCCFQALVFLQCAPDQRVAFRIGHDLAPEESPLSATSALYAKCLPIMCVKAVSIWSMVSASRTLCRPENSLMQRSRCFGLILW